MATETLLLIGSKAERDRRNPRGVYEKVRGSDEWWIRFVDALGRYRREKAGTKGAAIKLYRKRKTEALQGKKLPETLRRATVTFGEIAKDALAYSKANKRSHRDDEYRMKRLTGWFGSRPVESITPQDIEKALADAAESEKWLPGTVNRHRSLLSLTYRLAIRNGKVRENPVRHVPRKRENNIRTRFLSAEEEAALRTGAGSFKGTGIRLGPSHRYATERTMAAAVARRESSGRDHNYPAEQTRGNEARADKFRCREGVRNPRCKTRRL